MILASTEKTFKYNEDYEIRNLNTVTEELSVP